MKRDNNSHEPSYYGILIASIITVVFLVLLILINSNDTSYTELFFENIEDLPKEIVLGEEYSFSFALENKETEGKSYNYTIYIETDGNINTHEKGYIQLNQGENIITTVDFSLDQEFEQGRVSVVADDKEIYFSIIQA